jgi:hypothetical protein
MGLKKIKVGISIFIRKGTQSMWENGIFQNCVFLAELLERIPFVEQVFLVAGGASPEEVSAGFLDQSPVPLIDLSSAGDMLDVMVELSVSLPSEWITDFRAGGGRVVSMRCGNDYVIDNERMIFDLPPAHIINGATYDAVWILPEYEKTCLNYYKDTFRAPVYVAPHLWSPKILEGALGEVGKQNFGYKLGRRQWRVGIFEPNICMVKTSFMPILVCENAHRLNPSALEKVWIFNSKELSDDLGFLNFMARLDLKAHNLVSFEHRYPFFEIVSSNVDVLVCHQWENAQNYLYYETLYGGYPLIHNSDMIGDCGYFYQNFDCEQGGSILLEAFEGHDTNHQAYRATANKFLKTLHPHNASNISKYQELLGMLI